MITNVDGKGLLAEKTDKYSPVSLKGYKYLFSPRDTLCVWAGPPQHDSGTFDVMIKASPHAPLGKAHLWLGWLGGGGCSRVWSSEALAPGCLFAAGIVSACSKSHACARMSISFMPSSLVECTGTSARPPPPPPPPSRPSRQVWTQRSGKPLAMVTASRMLYRSLS